MMTTNSVVTFTFESEDKTIVISAKGFEELREAEVWGIMRASLLTINRLELFWLSHVFLDSKNFISLASPKSIAHLKITEFSF